MLKKKKTCAASTGIAKIRPQLLNIILATDTHTHAVIHAQPNNKKEDS